MDAPAHSPADARAHTSATEPPEASAPPPPPPRPPPDQLTVVLAACHPQQCTGYARVGCALANRLAARGVRVVYFAYQNVVPSAQRLLDPRISLVDVAWATGDRLSFGFDLLPGVVAHHGAHAVLLYNDILVLGAFLDALDRAPETARGPGASGRRPRVLSYVDLVHDGETPDLVDRVCRDSDAVLVFSEHWKRYLQAMHGTDPDRVAVLPHGVDAHFAPVPRAEARARLGLPPDAFLLLNTNRNSYRKALDVTVRVFLGALRRMGAPAEDGPDGKVYADFCLVLNCNAACETGYDIPGLVWRECRRTGMDAEAVLARNVLMLSNTGLLPDAVLNDLYNACDAGINTCVGEGFGLCNLEHACLGKPQLVSAVGGLRDIFQGDPASTVEPIETLELCRGFCVHGGAMEVPDSKQFEERLLALVQSSESSDAPSVGSAERAARLRQRYDWEAIGDELTRVLEATVRPNRAPVEEAARPAEN